MRGARARIPLAAGALAIAGTLLAITSAPADAVDSKDAARQLFAMTNLDRTSNGAAALKRDDRLGTIAVARSEDMLRRDYFSHQIPPDSTTVADIAESLGVPFRSIGENIAWNNANDFQTVQSAGQDFIESPHHRENLLDPRWDRMGTGVADASGKKMYTVVFMQTLEKQSSAAAQAAAPVTPVSRTIGERVELSTTRTGLIPSLVNAVVRLFLNL